MSIHDVRNLVNGHQLCTYQMMNFEWDERRRRSNLEKHGLDFVDVSAVSEGPHLVVPSVHSSEEERFLAVGLLEGR